MKLNLQLTNQTKILLGILVVALIAAIATQWGPGLYAVISNPSMKAKRQTLQTSKDLVAASKILKPVETGLYKKTGLADEDKPTTIFDGNFPDTVVREKIDSIVKKAGIPNNYQLNMELVPGKKSERISPQARRNLVVFLYQNTLETEKNTLETEMDALNAEMDAEIQAQLDIDFAAEEESLDMLMNAWLDEMDEDLENPPEKDSPDQGYTESQKQENSDEQEHTETDKDQKSENPDEKMKVDSEEVADEEKVEDDKPTEPSDYQTGTDKMEGDNAEWNFASLPNSIPISIRVELIDLIMDMVEQNLVGADNTLFENQFFSSQTKANPGFFSIGAKESKIEISFHPNSQILAKFRNLIDIYGEELDGEQLTIDLLEYLERIQSQIEELSQKLKLAPTTYIPESYTVKIKFKAEIDKLVNLNRLIETTSKWLMVKDLQISADNKQNKINVDVLMIARVYQ